MQEPLEKNIKNRLQNHEMTPPPMAWKNISYELHKKEKKRGFIWAKWMSVAAILIPAFLVTGVLLFNNSNTVENTPNLSNSSNTTLNKKTANDNLETENNLLTNDALNETKHEINTNSSLASSKKEHSVIDFIKDIFTDDKLKSNTQYVATADEDSSKKVRVFDLLTSPFQSDIKSELPKDALYVYASTVEDEPLTFEFLDEQENKNKIEEDELSKNKFEFSPYAGIAMLGSFDKSSLISPEFNQLSVDNDITTTYGAKASYVLNDRLKVKSGVGVINITQNTYNVPLLVNNNFSRHYNLKTSVSNANIHLVTDPNSVANQTNTLKQDLSQEMQFIEVPLEVEYKIAGSKKVEVNATTGVSSLILNKNAIYLKNNDIEFGEATNLNELSFSANAGVKLQYNITENVSANIEPQFKYYINTVTDNKDIKPYTVGVNAGLSYSL